MKQQKLIVANWKMNPQTYKEAEALAKSVLEYGGKDMVLCPPSIFLGRLTEALRRIRQAHRRQAERMPVAWGAQDVFYEKEGAYTGAVSVGMFRDAKVEYVLVGHSERRDPPAGGGDTDEIVRKKLLAALEGGLRPILFVGERERNNQDTRNKKQTLTKEKEFVRKQLQRALKGVLQPTTRRLQDDNEAQLIVAYEPVWAISGRSGGVSDTPESAGEMMRFIRNELKVVSSKLKVLYGGSVNRKNAEGFFGMKEVDGVVVGAASLKPEEFRTIVEAARI